MKSEIYLISSYYLNQLTSDERYRVSDQILFDKIKKKSPNIKVSLIHIDKVSRDEFLYENNLQKNLYEKYINLLAKRLNKTHNTNYPLQFWEKIIGLEILMHVHHCRYVYKLIKYNEENNLKMHILPFKDFQIPKDNNDYRKISQHSQIGYEQLSTTYFLQKEHSTTNHNFGNNRQNISAIKKDSIIKRLKSKTFKQLIIIFVRRVVSIVFKAITSPTILIVENIFSDQQYIKLITKSLGKVQILDNVEYENTNFHFQSTKRKIISKNMREGDDFDKFFFKSLYYHAPKSWLENFPSLNKFFENKVNSFVNLKAIVSESASESAQFLSACASIKNIQIYYNEHNLLQQYLMGNIIWFLKRRYEKYLSLGWTNKSHDVLPLGSLYRWKTRQKNIKNIKILFISSVASNKSPFHSAMYGEQGEFNSKSYFNMTKNFLANLKPDYLSKIYYRGHPHVKDKKYNDYAIDDNYFLKNYLKKVDIVDYNLSNSAVDLIARSEIVVINYLSTPWIQSLLANVPTIIIWNEETYFLDDNYLDYFDELLDNNIVFRNGNSAAQFLNKIYNDPKKWWSSREVQIARSNFLKSNFIEEEKLSSYILDLSK